VEWGGGAGRRLYLIIGGSCHKYQFVATKVLTRQTRVCRDKHVFVMTKHVFCRDKSKFVATKLSSWQNYVCRDKNDTCIIFVMTKDVFRRDKHVFVTTKKLSRQNYVCCDKYLS